MNKRSFASQITDYFYYASKPVCAKEVVEATGFNKATVYQKIKRLHKTGFLKEVESPQYPNRYYVLNIRTYNPLDSWMPNKDIIYQIMQAIGKGTTFTEMLNLPYSKETITVYLRALYAERIIGCKNRKYYLIEKDVNKMQLADLKSYPTLKDLKSRMKSGVTIRQQADRNEDGGVGSGNEIHETRCIKAKEPEDWGVVLNEMKMRL